MSLKKNFIYNVSYQILIIFLPLITTPYVARILGPEGVGLQSYTYSIANYFVLFAMLGISNYGNRSIAIVRRDKNKLNKTFSSIYILHLIISIILTLIYFLYIYFFVKENRMLFIIQAIYLISSIIDINWFFFGMEQFKLTVIRNTIIKLLSVISIFIFVKKSSDIYVYSLIMALNILISQVILWRFLKKYVNFVRVSLNEILIHVKPMIILFIPVIAISIYKIMDKIMLGSMSNVTQVGFLENSEKIINIPVSIIAALGTVMLPKMSNLYSSGNENESKKYIELSLEGIMFIAIGAMFGLIGVSNILIPIFLGNKFIECSKIVSLSAITIIFLAWANVIRTQFLIPKKKDKIYIISTILGAIINVIINLLLIKRYGAMGATIGTIFAEFTVAIYQTIMVRKELDILRYIKKTIFYIIPGSIMCIAIKYIGDILGASLITGIIQILTGGIIYCIISLLYMVYTKNQIILSFINNKKLSFIVKRSNN